MALTQALILINCYGITRKTQTLLMDAPCISVCFRGELEINGGRRHISKRHSLQASVIRRYRVMIRIVCFDPAITYSRR